MWSRWDVLLQKLVIVWILGGTFKKDEKDVGYVSSNLTIITNAEQQTSRNIISIKDPASIHFLWQKMRNLILARD